MTAHDFIAQLYSRVQMHVAGNVRYVTAAQFELLRRLIDEDEEGGAVKGGMNGGLVWMPSGRWKYVLSHDPATGRHSLTKLGNGTPSDAGTLFG